MMEQLVRTQQEVMRVYGGAEWGGAHAARRGSHFFRTLSRMCRVCGRWRTIVSRPSGRSCFTTMLWGARYRRKTVVAGLDASAADGDDGDAGGRRRIAGAEKSAGGDARYPGIAVVTLEKPGYTVKLRQADCPARCMCIAGGGRERDAAPDLSGGGGGVRGELCGIRSAASVCAGE